MREEPPDTAADTFVRLIYVFMVIEVVQAGAGSLPRPSLPAPFCTLYVVCPKGVSCTLL